MLSLVHAVALREQGHIHVHPYAAGTEGPYEASALLEQDGRSWEPIGR